MYKYKSEFRFNVGNPGLDRGTWRIQILLVGLHVKDVNCEQPGVKQTQPSVNLETNNIYLY